MVNNQRYKHLLILVILCFIQIGIASAYSFTTQTEIQNDTIDLILQNSSTTTPPTAKEAPTNNTIGTKKVSQPNLNKELDNLFSGVISPTLCVLGIIGNILNLIVLSRKEMQSSTNCFLMALAVSDMLLLAMQILPAAISINDWKGRTRIYILASRYLAIIRYVTSNIFITCTSWLTVAITIERFIAIRFALKARLICTIGRAKIAIAAIFLVSILFHFSKCFDYAPNLDHTNPRPIKMTPLSLNKIYDSLMHGMNIAVAVFIPEVSLFILNTLLIYFLVKHNRSMRHIKDKGRQELIQLTLVVITMVSVFMMCHSIGLYLAISIAIYSRKTVLYNYTGSSLRIINNFLVLVNSSVNFILYTAISKRFRESFNNVFCQCCKKMAGKKPLSLKLSSSSNTRSTTSGKSVGSGKSQESETQA